MAHHPLMPPMGFLSAPGGGLRHAGQATGQCSVLPDEGDRRDAIIAFLVAGCTSRHHAPWLSTLWPARSTDHEAITAWTCALLGFADATCIQWEPGELPRRHEPMRARRRHSTVPSRAHPTTRPLPRTRRWPQHLEPVGHWIRYGGSFVAGHRRRLNEGHSASADAVDRARQVGITLHRNETWVKAHARGIPDGIEMRFRWHTPTHLKLPEG